MNIAASNEHRLWKEAGVSSIADLPGFPFATHDEFAAAVRANKAAVGIDFTAARNMLVVVESRATLVFVQLLTWVPALLGLGSIPLAIARRDWLALLGVPAAAMAFIFASPYNPLHKIVLRFSVVAAGCLVFTGSAFAGFRWATICLGGSMFTLWYVNSIASECARTAVLSSEAFAAFLFKSRNLHIWDAAGRVHSLVHEG